MTACTPTRTGRALDFAEPMVEAEHLFTEIAHGLALIARFAGQTDTAYSVAQHSVLMAEACEDEIDDPLVAAYCLLHDGHKAYLGETPSPTNAALEAEWIAVGVEKGLPDTIVEAQIARDRYMRRRIEQRLDTAIHRAAGLPPIDDRARTIVKSYDVRALKTERRDLMKRWDPRPWHPSVEQAQPLLLRQPVIRPWAPGTAAERFILALNRLWPNAALAARRLAEGDAA